MLSIDVKISISKLTHYSESLHTRIDDKTLLLIIEKFSLYALELYALLIEEAMHSRRYKGRWEPLDEEGYIEYLGGTPSVSLLSAVKDSLRAKKVGNYFIVSIDKNYNYPGTALRLSDVVRAIESGTSKFRARPIIRKIARNMNSSMLELWKGYLYMKGVN